MKGKQFLAGMGGGSWTPKTVLREGGPRSPQNHFWGVWGGRRPPKICLRGRGDPPKHLLGGYGGIPPTKKFWGTGGAWSQTPKNRFGGTRGGGGPRHPNIFFGVQEVQDSPKNCVGVMGGLSRLYLCLRPPRGVTMPFEKQLSNPPKKSK